VHYISRSLIAASLLVATAAPARAGGFISPFIGYNFGGDSGNCASLTNCQEHRTNFGVSIGSMGTVLGIEEDISYAKNFFGDTPGADNSVFSAMTNLLVGLGVGPVQPYLAGGVGLIRPHVSLASISADKSAFGFDVGGGATVFVAPHIGFRGDVRHFRTLQDVNVLIFTGQQMDFWRGSVGLNLKF
jgi:opacity protein-like surface antigen